MQEVASETIAYLTASPFVSLILAFVAGLAAVKTVAYDRRSSPIVFMLVGLLGLFLGEFVIISLGLVEHLERISEFRFLFDFVAAYVASFGIAAFVHFVRPN